MKAGICCWSSVKMEPFLVLVLVALVASAELQDVIVEQHQETLQFQLFQDVYRTMDQYVYAINHDGYDDSRPGNSEIILYLIHQEFGMVSDYASGLANISLLHHLHDELNHRCSEYVETSVVNLTEEASNVTYGSERLQQTIRLKLKKDADVKLLKALHCIRDHLPHWDKNGGLFYSLNLEMLKDILVRQFQVTEHQRTVETLYSYVNESGVRNRSHVDVLLRLDIILYLINLQIGLFRDITSDFANIKLQTIYNDLHRHCAKYLETSIEDVRQEITLQNRTCVIKRLHEILKLKVKNDIDVALQKLRGQCTQQQLPFCKNLSAKCTRDYEKSLGKFIVIQIENQYIFSSGYENTPLEIISDYLITLIDRLSKLFHSGFRLLIFHYDWMSSFPTIEPFDVVNFLLHYLNVIVHGSSSESQDKSSWGIVKSRAGIVSHVCSQEYQILSRTCRRVATYHLNTILLECAYSTLSSSALTWSTHSHVYFHSQCLCVAFDGSDCGIKPPEGVDPYRYCLSVLLRDVQRQVTYRPALTYLDYAFYTRVPLCHFSNILHANLSNLCYEQNAVIKFNWALSVQCYFQGLTNKQLNCSESLIVDTYNKTVLCGLLYFTEFVFCDDDGAVEVPVPYYEAGDSSVVLLLTYVDVVARVLTLVTYLACQQLRNLPGKLLIGYMSTSLLRLLVVRLTLSNMALAVRLDVAFDLACTFCLFSYLHFLTVSIRDLRPPNSISRDEARVLLLRYSMLGWVLPAALAVSFLWMDTVIENRVIIGQLVLPLCNYWALFGNIYMCFVSFKIYYDVKNDVRDIKRGSSKRDDIIALFSFAIKTSVLSGAGFTLRLVFAQFEGLEELLGYYHALSTLQGLFIFFLYGWGREVREFWLQVFRSTLSRLHCRRPQNAPV